MSVTLDKYIAAQQSYLELLQQAQQCVELFTSASVNVPDPLRAFLNNTSLPIATRAPKPKKEPASIIPPTRPRQYAVPPGGKVDWISVALEDATISTLVLAFLADSQYLSASGIVSKIRAIHPDTVANSVFNAINRLVAESKITVADADYIIASKDIAPIIEDGYLWGDSDLFYAADVTSYRREVMLALIEKNPGIVLMDIVRTLENLPWFPKRFNKDSAKTDLEALRTRGAILRRPETKGWEAKEKEAPEETS